MALYEPDGKYHEAVVEVHDVEHETYTVRFLGYNNLYEVDESEAKELDSLPQGWRDGGLDPETGMSMV